ncbi:MAG: tRNA pseudouridine(55) synthase TruB [Actinobacteria bacterium]|nr:tRNA pseudouridine(55) synthase TruB [Actinomycetota bacterium]
MAKKPSAFNGVVIVDKPTPLTSHDVVARLREITQTRQVGHAGTLDPMATGVLICGIGKATKLLGRIADTNKSYNATIRLGISTSTDDAQGHALESIGVANRIAAITEQLPAEVERLTGEIMQRPSSISAIKVDGKRAYHRVRAGEEIDLPLRPVSVTRFEVLASRPSILPETETEVLDVEVEVDCTTGTYIRALARDLGAALGVGGHVIALRRTAVGPFGVDSARTLDDLANDFSLLSLPDTCDLLYRGVQLADEPADWFRHGRRSPWPSGLDPALTVAVSSSEQLLGLAECKDGLLAPTVVWAPANEEPGTSPSQQQPSVNDRIEP